MRHEESEEMWEVETAAAAELEPEPELAGSTVHKQAAAAAGVQGGAGGGRAMNGMGWDGAQVEEAFGAGLCAGMEPATGMTAAAGSGGQAAAGHGWGAGKQSHMLGALAFRAPRPASATGSHGSMIQGGLPSHAAASKAHVGAGLGGLAGEEVGGAGSEVGAGPSGRCAWLRPVSSADSGRNLGSLTRPASASALPLSTGAAGAGARAAEAAARVGVGAGAGSALHGLRFPQLLPPPPASSQPEAAGGGNGGGAGVAGCVGVPALPPAPQRHVSIPTSADSVPHFLHTMVGALVEEVSIGLAAAAQPFHNAVVQVLRSQQAQAQGQGQGQAFAPGSGQQAGSGWGAGGTGSGSHGLNFGAGDKAGLSRSGNVGFQKPAARSKGGVGHLGVGGVNPAATAAAVEKLCVMRHVPYFSNCDMVVRKPWVPRQAGGWAGAKKARGGRGKGRFDRGGGGDGDDDDEEVLEDDGEGGGSRAKSGAVDGMTYFLVVKPPAKGRLKNCR